MKTKFILFTLLTLLLGLASCSDDDKKSTEYVVTVASVQRIEFIADHHQPYYVKQDKATEWTSHSYIEGFKHSEGYEYVIKVREDYDKAMEGMIGGSPYSYSLVEVVSKSKKDSENIPLQEGHLTIGSRGTGDVQYPYYASSRISEWEKIAPIKGFDYVEGYEYGLVVHFQYNGVDAPQKYSYNYIKTSNKEQKDSIGLPN